MTADTVRAGAALPDGVTLSTRGGVERLEIDLPGGVRGAVALQGGHVLSWCPPGADDVLFLSRHARFEPGVAVRGGVPVCFPWFGPGRSGEAEPAHGWARTAPWELVSVTTPDAGARVTLRVGGALESGVACTLTLEVFLGAELVVDVLLEAPEGETAEIALHSYLRVASVDAARVEGLEGAGYLDQLTGERHRQVGGVTFTEETDRVYELDGPVVLRTGGSRDVEIVGQGLGSAVVWNPWVDKAARTKDLGDDEWREFVCVEAGAVRERALVVGPGGRATSRLVMRPV